MPSADLSKFDSGLISLYKSWLRLEENGWDSGHAIPVEFTSGKASLLLRLEFADSPTEAEAVGFRTVEVLSTRVARGHVKMEDLADISQLSSVEHLKYGEKTKPVLDTSTIAIRVRDTANALNNGLWHFTDDPPTFTGNTGEGVVIGIIDTGIDWKHEFFRTADGQDTRIMAIWDQALEPVAGENSPDQALIATAKTYGVEYEADKIKAAIFETPGFKPVRHRDTDGHGTHVAGIAAGNGRPSFLNIGVAPQAKIIAVNYLDAQGKAEVDGSKVSSDDLFKDALAYIRNKARKSNLPEKDATLPVVINCSLGSDFNSHDGRGVSGTSHSENDLRDFRFSGNTEIPGSVVVFASGNAAGKKAHFRATKGSSTLIIPFEIHDRRSTKDDSSLRIECWYADNPGDPPNITVELETPSPDSKTTGPVAQGDSKEVKFDVSMKKEADIFHFKKTARSGVYGDVTRFRCSIVFTPESKSFLTSGKYKLKIEGKEGTELYFWTDYSRKFRINIDIPAISGSSPPAFYENRETCGSPGHCPDVITVANYNDVNNQLWYSSSRGPLVFYDNPPAAPFEDVFNKPDLAAPGRKIKSAGDGLVKKCKCCKKVDVAVNYTDKTGTSMASPHVAGVVALMLQKNKALTQTQVRKHLQDNTFPDNPRYLRKGTSENWGDINDSSPRATAAEVGKGVVDAKKAVDAVPANTP